MFSLEQYRAVRQAAGFRRPFGPRPAASDRTRSPRLSAGPPDQRHRRVDRRDRLLRRAPDRAGPDDLRHVRRRDGRRRADGRRAGAHRQSVGASRAVHLQRGRAGLRRDVVDGRRSACSVPPPRPPSMPYWAPMAWLPPIPRLCASSTTGRSSGAAPVALVVCRDDLGAIGFDLLIEAAHAARVDARRFAPPAFRTIDTADGGRGSRRGRPSTLRAGHGRRYDSARSRHRGSRRSA